MTFYCLAPENLSNAQSVWGLCTPVFLSTSDAKEIVPEHMNLTSVLHHHHSFKGDSLHYFAYTIFYQELMARTIEVTFQCFPLDFALNAANLWM